MKRNLFLISGKAGSGKDFVGKIFCENGYKRLAFADYLKDIASNIYKLDRKDFDTQEGKSKIFSEHQTYRDVLINMSAMHKYKDINVFTNIIINTMKSDKIFNYVISDFRFPHEYEHMKSELGEFFNIFTIYLFRQTSLVIDDPSEHALDNFKFHYTISNNSTKNYLEAKLRSLGFF